VDKSEETQENAKIIDFFVLLCYTY